MANLLYLVHRLPYPPNKGDKVRSYHLLKHLAARHRVFSGTFVDDPDDEVHIDAVRAMCADLYVARLKPRLAKLRSLSGLVNGQSLSEGYYRDAGLRAWVNKTRAANAIDATVVFSSVMAQYSAQPAGDSGGPELVDFVDVDSAKWAQYATQHRWPMSWVYAREGARLLAYERAVAQRAQRSFFVTEKEVALFQGLAPESRLSIEAMGNGVDAEFFTPDYSRPTPFAPGQAPVVFTGAMDYWPNIDAVTWFAADILPRLRETSPQLQFYIVGRSPSAAVLALASDAVVVTGTVPDVRPFLQHAGVVVAPMRIARGVQNKILEAMAMGRPVVAARDCVDAIDATLGEELLSAQAAEDYVEAIRLLLQQPDRASAVGGAGRQCVLRKYSWDAHLAGIDRYLPSTRAMPSLVGSGVPDAIAGLDPRSPEHLETPDTAIKARA